MCSNRDICHLAVALLTSLSTFVTGVAAFQFPGGRGGLLPTPMARSYQEDLGKLRHRCDVLLCVSPRPAVPEPGSVSAAAGVCGPTAGVVSLAAAAAPWLHTEHILHRAGAPDWWGE